MAKRAAPEVNAGSMADIAFLLLIFFLVTTTIETDSGISRKLPPIQDLETPPPPLKQKNIFEVVVNKNNQLLVEGELAELKEVRQAAIDFLDNNGDGSCTFCRGSKNPASSDNPIKAVVSLNNDRETNYGTYIAVQNELVAAYTSLRNREAQRLYNRSFEQMEKDYKDVNNPENKTKLKEKLKVIKEMFPEKLSEAEAKNK